MLLLTILSLGDSHTASELMAGFSLQHLQQLFLLPPPSWLSGP